MRLTVRHSTRYSFATPVRGIIQSHRLIPSDFEGQRIMQWDVTVPGGTIGCKFRDGAGDWLQTLSLRAGPVEHVEIEVSGVVDTTDTAGVLRGHRETVPPVAYRRHTVRTSADKALTELSRDTLADLGDASALDQAHALAHAVSKTMPYLPGETHAATTAAEALAHGSGVCQDHSHVLIALAHVAGLPARYVTGYLNATEDGSPHEASHAWAEIHVAGLGWVGFDASNSCCPNEHYIRLGSGLDAADAAPLRGLVLGGAEEALSVTLSVEAAQQ